jgi:type IV pilus assembly protein PilY1
VVIPELGESWSVPQFGLVKTFAGDASGTAVMFIGGGYTSDNSLGKAVLAINVLTGAVVKTFKNDGVDITDMNYSIPSSLCVLDTDNNGFVDKVYVGDLGSQMWRFGKFTDFIGDPLGFPNTDENINNWEAEVLFLSDATHTRKFFYPPSLTLEKGYDLVFMGTGDREDACATSSAERIYCVKDMHASTTLEESDLVDVTDPADPVPDLNSVTGDVDGNTYVDQGWYIQLAAGEKVLAEGTIFYKALYVTTFTPNNDPCLPGGVGKLYALNHLTGGAVVTFGGADLTRSVSIGGGIPSKPVMVITAEGTQKLFVSVGSTNPDASSESFAAGIVAIDPLGPPLNFFYLWWKELIG